MSADESWAQEMESVFLYGVIAEVEASPERRALFTKLAGEARGQADIWAEKIRAGGGKAPDGFAPPARARIVAMLVRRLGPAHLKGILAAMKVRGMSVYGDQPGTLRGSPFPPAMGSLEQSSSSPTRHAH